MNAHDIALQIAQVVTVIALSPLLQGVILQWEERVQRARGPGIFQAYRDLWKLSTSNSSCPTPLRGFTGPHQWSPLPACSRCRSLSRCSLIFHCRSRTWVTSLAVALC